MKPSRIKHNKVSQEWLASLKFCDKVKLVFSCSDEKIFAVASVYKSETDKIGVITNCGIVKWFSRKNGFEINKSSSNRGRILQPR